jgi:hypothetical protein
VTLSQKEQHERILYPVVRVHTEKAGGSGTIIYSKPNPDNPEEYQTFVLTCAHVVEDAISTKRDWDSVLKKKIEKELLEQVTAEVFDYVYLSRVNSSNSHKADIVAYDKYHDIAILKLDSPKQAPYVAKLIPKDNIKDVKLFTPVWTSGCSLLHEPFANPGFVTFLSEMIENKLYWMVNASSIFGNSGGAVFLADTGEQVGISARITTIQLGFSTDVTTWMGFCVAPQRLYEFFDEQELQFLYDPKDTYKAGMARRESKSKNALMQMVGADDEDKLEEKPAPEEK